MSSFLTVKKSLKALKARFWVGYLYTQGDGGLLLLVVPTGFVGNSSGWVSFHRVQ
jgi:hypothetical protein